LRSQEIRKRFLGFFEERGHYLLPNASLIPGDDPSLLFTVAGMVPLKPFISGERTPPSPRLTSCQRCFRGSGLTTDDISAVGDCSHHTFFEMLGNWSIGDYFKAGAIDLAWELLTETFGLDPARLVPSVYPDDDESVDLWRRRIGVPAERISRISDNWWQAGPTGPCGFDSEIYWDWGPPCACGRSDCRPEDECGGDRFAEIWNLVFMEFEQGADGARSPLPQRSVDTGMGLERMAAVLQGVRCNYDTDLLRPIVDGFDRRIGAGRDAPGRTRSLRVLADHARGATFLIADGVVPGNEGRGYVLRRVIRRAALHGRRLHLEGGLAGAVADVVDVMGDVYPELSRRRALVETTLRAEEEVFARTVEAASERLETLLSSGGGISGEDAFRLYDTFGLPIELTVEMATERGLAVDRAGFDAALEVQRQRSRRRATSGGWNAAAGSGHLDLGGGATGTVTVDTEFVGYDTLSAASTAVRIGAGGREALEAGEEDSIFLDVSPFYAEAGGQVGDMGTLTWEDGHAQVLDCVNVVDGAVHGRAHGVRVEAGTLATGQTLTAQVDAVRRARIARHHSATHLLHRALRESLGEGVVQRGSFVGPDHATFDFSFPRAMTAEEVRSVEWRVNGAIRDNLSRGVTVMAVDEARASGAMALFGEKYGERVRVVDFGGWTRELCGGTHVAMSGDIGAAIVVSESSIGQGTRRIELVVGEAAERRWEESDGLLRETARTLRVRPGEVPLRVAQLLAHNRELQGSRRAAGGDGVADRVKATEVSRIGGYPAAVADDAALTGEDAVSLADRLLAERLGAEGVAAVFGENTVCVRVGGSALAAGLDAGRIAAAAAAASGGRGGGRPGFGRGALKEPARRGEALAAFRAAIEGDRP
jgi:alanyl-tRNA synthetase